MAFREISFQAANAFYNGRNFKKDNTEVVALKDGVGVFLYLFGNLIAERNRETRAVKITNAGYSSKTTKERLTALNFVNIKQVKGVWYLNGKEWDGEWIYVEGSGDTTAKGSSPFNALGLLGAFADLMGGNKKDTNDFKARMVKATMGAGIDFPEDWDTLTEEEKERRLNGVIAIATETK